MYPQMVFRTWIDNRSVCSPSVLTHSFSISMKKVMNGKKALIKSQVWQKGQKDKKMIMKIVANCINSQKVINSILTQAFPLLSSLNIFIACNMVPSVVKACRRVLTSLYSFTKMFLVSAVCLLSSCLFTFHKKAT